MNASFKPAGRSIAGRPQKKIILYMYQERLIISCPKVINETNV